MIRVNDDFIKLPPRDRVTNKGDAGRVLVVGGDIVMPLAREKGVNVLPVDSEHCAIHECISGHDKNTVNKLIITGS